MPKVKHFLIDDDISTADQKHVLQMAQQIKNDPGIASKILVNSAIGLLFEHPSLRTRVSAEVACRRVGAHPVQLRINELQIDRGESPQDTAKVLAGFLSLLLARVKKHSLLTELAEPNTLPVVNGLSNLCHPLQILADLLTLSEEWGEDNLVGKKLAYVGDGNNVATSLLLGGAMAGLVVHMATPENYALRPEFVERAQHIASKTGGEVKIFVDPLAACKGAHAVYTDVWTSMGQEEQGSERKKVFSKYQLNHKLLEQADSKVVVLHCLPAHPGEEITQEVLDSPFSRHLNQAHNRLPATAALFLLLLAPEFLQRN